jgi:integration host factor subunit beta
MTRSELVQRVADKSLQLHRTDVKRVVNAVLEEVLTALACRDRVELRGFGAFAVKIRSASSGRNPKTGDLVGVRRRPMPLLLGSWILFSLWLVAVGSGRTL